MTNFNKLSMSRFSEQFHGMNLTSMHSTNPEPFSKKELEEVLGRSFAEILEDVSLGFAADEGSIELRHTIAENLYPNTQADDVIAHAGAQEALYCVLNALLEKNDDVLVVVPAFEPLIRIPQNIGSNIRTIELQSKHQWKLDLKKVEEEFKSGCKVFIINFPHNPTGAYLSDKEFEGIINLCRKYDVWLLSDEVFRGLEHDENIKLPAVADVYEKGISIGVISKAFAIPGIRIGWLVCKDAGLRSKVLDVKGYLSVCNSQIDEKLAVAILKMPNQILQRNLQIIRRNKELIRSEDKLFGFPIKVKIPESGCSLFAELIDADAEEFTKMVAEKYGYLIYPSSLFSTNINAVRIGFGSKKFSEFIKKGRAVL